MHAHYMHVPAHMHTCMHEHMHMHAYMKCKACRQTRVHKCIHGQVQTMIQRRLLHECKQILGTRGCSMNKKSHRMKRTMYKHKANGWRLHIRAWTTYIMYRSQLRVSRVLLSAGYSGERSWRCKHGVASLWNVLRGQKKGWDKGSEKRCLFLQNYSN